MKQVIRAAAICCFVAGLAVLASCVAVAQSKSPKELLVGTWTLASADSVRSDSSRTPVFGASPKGTLIFTGDGHFSLIQMRADVPRIAANSRDQGTSEEYKSIVSGSIAYFGTYSFNAAEKTIVLQLAGSTYVNLIGGDQKRIVTKLTPDDLTFTNPRNPSGMTLEVTWKRAR